MSTVARVNAEITLKDNLSKPLKDAEKDVQEFAEKAKRSIGKFSADASKKWEDFGKKLGDLGSKLQGTGLALNLGVTAPLGLVSKQIIDAAAKMETMRASMAALTGSSATAGTQLAELEKMSARTATSYDLLVQASQGLIAGFDGDVGAANAVLERFAVLSNVLGVSKGDFERLVVNLTQIGGSARLAGDELRETAAILPNLRVLLKQAFGTSNSEDLAKMGISGRKALEEIAKAIDAQGFKAKTDTYNAQVNQLSTAFFKLKVSAGEVLLPIAKDIVEKLGPAFDKLGEFIRNLSPAQKQMILNFGLAAAAAGPLILGVGSVIKSIQSLSETKELVTSAFKAFTAAVAESGGVLATAGGAIQGLLGPIGILIAVVGALALAYQTNFAGVRDSLNALWKDVQKFAGAIVGEIRAWVADNQDAIAIGWGTIKTILESSLKTIVEVIKVAWEIIKAVVGSAVRIILGIITTFTAILQGNWSKAFETIKATFISVWQTIGAALARIGASILEVFQNIINGALGLINQLIKRAGGQEIKVSFLDGAINGLRKYADDVDKIREKAAKSKPVQFDIFGGLAGKKDFGTPSSSYGTAAVGADTKQKKAKENKETNELIRLTNQLTAAKMAAAGAARIDIMAVEEYGKTYAKITDPVNKMIIAKKAELAIFNDDISLKKEYADTVKGLTVGIQTLTAASETERALIELRASDLYQKLNPAQKQNLELLTRERIARELSNNTIQAERDARNTLNESVRGQILEMQKSIALINATTEVERIRYDVTVGGLKNATAFQKIFLLAQAASLDQANRTKIAAEKTKAFWADLTKQIKEYSKSQYENSKDKYDEYIKRLTQNMLELQGATEQVIRADLREQFKGLAIGAKTTAEGIKRVEDAVNDVMNKRDLTDEMKQRIELIKKVVTSMESLFVNAFRDMFENGFKGFFDSVVTGFRTMVAEIAQELIKLQIRRALIWGIGQIFGAGAGKEAASALSGKAVGGRVEMGTPYLIGETGPEVFVPRSGGSIVPNYNLAGGGGNTNIIVNVKTESPRAFRKSEAQIVAEVFARASRSRARDGRG